MSPKKKKPFAVKPTLFAACVELAEGSAVAGGLLCQVSLLTEHGSLKDEKNIEGWLALSSPQWRVLTGYTRHQHNQALKFLKDMPVMIVARLLLQTDPDHA